MYRIHADAIKQNLIPEEVTAARAIDTIIGRWDGVTREDLTADKVLFGEISGNLVVKWPRRDKNTVRVK